jgi:hypothetical protein
MQESRTYPDGKRSDWAIKNEGKKTELTRLGAIAPHQRRTITMASPFGQLHEVWPNKEHDIIMGLTVTCGGA